MRYAILSDIHGNLEALQAVLRDIEQQGVDKIVCLGDVVGYGPNPNECVDVIREKAHICLMGNHDYAAIGKEPIEYFNPYARDAILWTRRQLTGDNLAFLRDLPFLHIDGEITFVHSSPHRPEDWTYILTPRDVYHQFNFMQTPLCFVGHSHVAIGFARRGDDLWILLEDEHRLEDHEARYIINVGAVGQPRDQDPRASYGLYDSGQRTFQFRRIEYDIEAVQKQMEEAGLPQYLIDRLSYGR
jgi:predicted phosphodiesterase